jgi:hypothetical protein
MLLWKRSECKSRVFETSIFEGETGTSSLRSSSLKICEALSLAEWIDGVTGNLYSIDCILAGTARLRTLSQKSITVYERIQESTNDLQCGVYRQQLSFRPTMEGMPGKVSATILECKTGLTIVKQVTKDSGRCFQESWSLCHMAEE